MARHGYRSLNFIFIVDTIFLIGAVPSFYHKTYNGSTLMIPLRDGDNRSPLSLSSSFAKQWCSNNGASLLRITDESDQRMVFQFIRSAVLTCKPSIIIQNIFLNNIYYDVFNWSWVNGLKTEGFEIRPLSHKVEYPVGYLWTNDYKIKEGRPIEQRRYICEASTHSSNSSLCETMLDERCYWKKDVRLTWYQARSTCLNQGGDLASFEKHNEKILKAAVRNLGLNPYSDYWVGIYKGVWRWDDNDSDPEIKYSNWNPSHPPSYNAKCLCLNKQRIDYDWIECDCNRERPFICKRNDSFTSAANITTETSDQLTPSVDQQSTIVTGTTTSDSLTKTFSFSGQSQSPDSTSAIISCVIIFAVAIIVVVVVNIIRKQRNRQVCSTRDETFEAQMETTRNNEFPIYAQVQKTREPQTTAIYSVATDTTYATVQPTAVETNEDSQANSVVYADLDLQPRANSNNEYSNFSHRR